MEEHSGYIELAQFGEPALKLYITYDKKHLLSTYDENYEDENDENVDICVVGSYVNGVISDPTQETIEWAEIEGVRLITDIILDPTQKTIEWAEAAGINLFSGRATKDAKY